MANEHTANASVSEMAAQLLAGRSLKTRTHVKYEMPTAVLERLKTECIRTGKSQIRLITEALLLAYPLEGDAPAEE